MKIAIDFDGTCVTHDYPNIGKDIGAVKYLRKLVQNGHKLILYTMRSGIELQDAIDWFKNNKIELYSIGTDKDQTSWTKSNKCYAEMYIDDLALGAPLKMDLKLSINPFIDWIKVAKMLNLED